MPTKISPSPYTELSLIDLREKILKREVLPSELAKIFLERIRRYNTSLQAFLFVNEDQVQERAHYLDTLLEEGKEKDYPLLGIPIAISDAFLELEEAPLSYGSLSLEGNISSKNSFAINALLHAGALIIGKTNVSEFCFKDETVNRLGDSCRNPWKLSHSVGGPCGGGACAVSAGLATAALGPSLRGGVEIPASFCGLFSLIFSSSRIPMNTVTEVLHRPFLTYGVTTKNCEDAALLADVLCLSDSSDSDTFPPFPLSHTQFLQNQASSSYKVAWFPELNFLQPSSEASPCYTEALDLIEKNGSEIERIHFLETEEIFPYYQTLMSSHISLLSSMAPKESINYLEEETSSLLPYASTISSGDYLFAKGIMKLMKDQVYQLLNSFDFLLSPVCPIESFPLHELPKEVQDRPLHPLIGLHGYIWPLSFMGLARATLPIGLSKEGLPVGMHIITRAKEEAKILHFVKGLQASLPKLQAPSLEESLNLP